AGARLSAIDDDLSAALADHEAGWAPTPESRSASSAAPAAARAALASPRASRPAVHADPAEPAIDLQALYRQAEAAMRQRSVAEARRTLKIIAARDRGGQLGEAALVDLARLATAGRARGRRPRPPRRGWARPRRGATGSRAAAAPPPLAGAQRDGGAP